MKYSLERKGNEWKQYCSEKHNWKYDYSKSIYNGIKNKLIITCPIHGDFEQIADNHRSGKGCPKCAIEFRGDLHRREQKEFIDSCNKIHNNYYNYDKVEYTSVNNKIIIICPEHGDFTQRASAHESGQGCPICSIWKSELELFNIIKRNFPDLIIEQQYSPKWLNGKRFDIAIPELKIAIEYNGKQHYEYIPYFHIGGIIDFEKQLKRDNEKRNECLMNNYILKELKYNYTEMELKEIIQLICNLNDRRK